MMELSMKKLRYWMPVLLAAWAVFIFCRSLQPADMSTLESKWFLDLLQRLFPLELSIQAVRKLAHFAEFAVLGVLAGLLFGGRCRRVWTSLLFAGMTGIVIALCDETIQLFVEGRSSQITDVWIDVAGASAGAVLALAAQAVWRWRTSAPRRVAGETNRTA